MAQPDFAKIAQALLALAHEIVLIPNLPVFNQTQFINTYQELVQQVAQVKNKLEGRVAELQGRADELQGRADELQGRLQGRADELQGRLQGRADELQGRVGELQGQGSEM